MTGIRLRAWDGSDAQLALIADLYADTFSEPPYREDPAESRASLIERVPRYAATKPHFRLIIAWDGATVAGFAFGTGIAAGDWWRDHIVDLLPPTARTTWLRDECFSVAELAIAPEHRRRGIAGRLMAELLAEAPYPTAVLGCYADAKPARQLYAALGWQELVTDVHIGKSPALCILGRMLS